MCSKAHETASHVNYYVHIGDGGYNILLSANIQIHSNHQDLKTNSHIVQHAMLIHVPY